MLLPLLLHFPNPPLIRHIHTQFVSSTKYSSSTRGETCNIFFACKDKNMTRPWKLLKKKPDLFDSLHDDLVVFILSRLSATASSPSQFINVILTCKRLNRLGMHRLVLCKAGHRVLAVKPKNWSQNSHNFLKRCVYAGNVEACYTLGMIQFYCLENRKSGLSLMAKAAAKLHAAALYSLAVIQFNGSGGSKLDKDLQTGVTLSMRAAMQGNIDAIRELGHCLQDGYGVQQNVEQGRRLLVQANLRELACVLHALSRPRMCSSSVVSAAMTWQINAIRWLAKVRVVNLFLREWFESGMGKLEEGLRLCSHIGCGRPETRPHEFRRCSVCGRVNYCSRACQALDWKLRHKTECSPLQFYGEDEARHNAPNVENYLQA